SRVLLRRFRAGYPPGRTANGATKDGMDLQTVADGAGLSRELAPGGGGRAPPAAPVPLPVLRGSTAPDTVNLAVAERELQALAPHSAIGADLLGPRDLPFR